MQALGTGSSKRPQICSFETGPVLFGDILGKRILISSPAVEEREELGERTQWERF